MDLDLYSIKEDENNKITNLSEINEKGELKAQKSFEINPKEVETKGGAKFAVKLDQADDNDKTSIENPIEINAAQPNMQITPAPELALGNNQI